MSSPAILCEYIDIEKIREGLGALERGALPMSLPAVRFGILFGAGFLEKHHVYLVSILGHCLNVVSLAKALNPQGEDE